MKQWSHETMKNGPQGNAPLGRFFYMLCIKGRKSILIFWIVALFFLIVVILLFT